MSRRNKKLTADNADLRGLDLFSMQLEAESLEDIFLSLSS